jgi:hypothetical protein
MPEELKPKRGGYREGAGRKKDPLRNAQLGAATALKILAELKHEKELVSIYKTCGDARLKAHIIFRLREWGYGKPIQMEEINANVKGSLTLDPSERLERVTELLARAVKVGSRKTQ